MRALRLLLVLSVLLAGVVAAPASATDDWTPTYRTERVYFKCHGPTKLGNVSGLFEGPVPWDTDAPTGSVQDGAGCGSADTYVRGTNPQNVLYDVAFAGEFQGNLNSLTAHLYALPTADRAWGTATDVFVGLSINGVEVLQWPTRVEAAPFVVENSDATQRVDLSVNGIQFSSPSHDTWHDVALTVSVVFSDAPAVWVWDTTEVPAGITFNPEQLVGTVVQAYR